MSAAVLPYLPSIMSLAAVDGTRNEIPERPEAPKRKKSHQARVVRITDIAKHPNADTLGIVHIDGYQVVVKLGEFEINSLAVYVQPDSVVPSDSEEFAFMWAGKGFVEGDFIPVKYRRVIPRKFRKEWSEGLLISVPEWARFDDHGVWREIGEGDDLADVLEITHYEPAEPLDRRQERKEYTGWPRSLAGWWYWLLELLGFHPNGNTGGRNQYGPKGDRKVYDVESFKNYQNVFIPGEPVVVTEKIHGSNARFTCENDVQLRDSLCASDACSFQQKLNGQQSFIFRNRHAAKQARSTFGVGLSTLSATKTAKATPLLPKLRAFDVASSAIHRPNIQQALAVSQAELSPTLQLHGGI